VSRSDRLGGSQSGGGKNIAFTVTSDKTLYSEPVSQWSSEPVGQWSREPVDQCERCGLTEQLVGSAVERLADRRVLVLLVVLDGPEVGQRAHEAPEVHLVLAGKRTHPKQVDRVSQSQRSAVGYTAS